VSKRREIERRLHNLGEIREIMNAMKNLALMETYKLARLSATQRRVAASIASAVTEFLSFHSDLLGAGEEACHACLLLGSERGFCGDFNEALVRALHGRAWRGSDPALIVVGGKLAGRIDEDPRVVARLEGAATLEQVDGVLLTVMKTLDRWRATQAPGRALNLTVLHHGADAPEVMVTRLDPRGQQPPQPPRRGHAPLLNLEPRRFFGSLGGHYLHAALHGIFYESLMAENRRRAQHMDAAVRRIDERSLPLVLERNSLRQEEITEEIEVIMLSIETLRAAYPR
jgi:F-type H+-transporting ATPase subunit gamma